MTDNMQMAIKYASAQLAIEHVDIDIDIVNGIPNVIESPTTQSLNYKHRRSNDMGLCIQWTPTRYTILINNNFPDDIISTLGHELYHVMEYVNNIPSHESICDAYGLQIANRFDRVIESNQKWGITK